MGSRWATAIVLAALLLLAPWPWYLVAVGGLLPVAVIVLMALGLVPEPLLAGLLAVCAAAGIAAFYFIARWFGRRSPASFMAEARTSPRPRASSPTSTRRIASRSASCAAA
jgi:hypothetical protein